MKSSASRRQFCKTIGTGVAAVQFIPLYSYSSIPTSGESVAGWPSKFWIDSRFAKHPEVPWRMVHLDFHNTKHISKIGEKFKADEWGDRLVAANVNSVNVFAKDMQGYFYYPSKYGPVHPGLSFDLLGEQVKACRERNIEVYAYYCAAWDNYLFDKHPEWRMFKRNGSDYGPKTGEVPGWTALCLGNKDFVELMSDHIGELASRYEIDWVFIDMAEPIAAECYCKECIRQIKTFGKDPYNKDIQRDHQNRNFLDFHRKMKERVSSVRPGCRVGFNDIGIGSLSERINFLENIDIEALPTSLQWGYFFGATLARYSRTFGVPIYGTTGRFVNSWGDFGGLKLPQQLDVEFASLVANCIHCSVGDQMPPNGQLDAAVYHVIGKSFDRIKQLEPWLDHAAPVTEAVLLVPDLPLEQPAHPEYVAGLTKLLIESHIQFDVVEPRQEWERYNLVVIPDELMPDNNTIERLHKYIDNDGAVIVCHNGGLQAETKNTWLEKYGMKFDGLSPFKPAYLVTKDGFVKDMPGFEYALYNGASRWKVQSPAISMAPLGEPLFNRSPEHYTSHQYFPIDHVTDYTVLATNKKVGLIGFPIGVSYYSKGYWIYRSAFNKVLSEVLQSRLVETNAPVSAEITITFQPASNGIGRPARYMVHIINWSSARKTPQYQEVHEDPVALTDIKVKLNIPLKNVTVKTVCSGINLEHTQSGKGIEVLIPRIPVHEIVVFEYKE